MKLKKRSGFTLVELILAIAIGALVLSGVYGLFFFGDQTYRWGNTQNIIQNNLRLASDIIRDQVRYASRVTVLDTMPAPADIDANLNYIYVQDSKSLYVQNAGDSPREMFNFTESNMLLTTQPFKVNQGTSGWAISYTNTVNNTPIGSQVLNLDLLAVTPYNREYNLKTDINILNANTSVNLTPYLEGPTVSPEEGAISLGSAITLSATGSDIYYTINRPDDDILTLGNKGTNAVSHTVVSGDVDADGEINIRAIAVQGELKSFIAEYTFYVASQTPKAINLSINGVFAAGNSVTFTYSYISSVSQGASVIEWWVKQKNTGNLSKVATATYNASTPVPFTFALKNSHKGDEIFAKVTPRNSAGTVGTTETSGLYLISP